MNMNRVVFGVDTCVISGNIKLDQHCKVVDSRGNGAFTFQVVNCTNITLKSPRLRAVRIRCLKGSLNVRGATLEGTRGGEFELVAPDGFDLASGECWEICIDGVTECAGNVTDGIYRADIISQNLNAISLKITALKPPPLKLGDPEPVAHAVPSSDTLLFIHPAPSQLDIGPLISGHALCLDSNCRPAEQNAFLIISALHRRLFPSAKRVLVDASDTSNRKLQLNFDESLERPAYLIDFQSVKVSMRYGGSEGLIYGLISLAQMCHAAIKNCQYRLPESGTIYDRPRFDWRGCHLDIARAFMDANDIGRLIDILAWNKMNRLHLHLTDDEAWRIPSHAMPCLNEYRSMYFADSRHYSTEEIRELVAHAGSLGIEIMPELDMPGHSAHLLSAIPGLMDPDEPSQSYRSFHGFFNNALNPGIPKTTSAIETLLGEIADLFPFNYIHVGWDEVVPEAWLQSPRAVEFTAKAGLTSPSKLNGWLLCKVLSILDSLGRRPAGWDDIVSAGAKPEDGVLVFAWQSQKLVSDLAHRGYNVIASPGQTYYLDIRQADDWFEPGAAWAGISSPKQTYLFDPPWEASAPIAGVQACIWMDPTWDRSRFNHMVFPRLSAIADAGWSEKVRRSWSEFCSRTVHLPVL